MACGNTPLLLEEQGYYGRRDFRPWEGWRKIRNWVCIVILSPILLILFVIYLLIHPILMYFIEVNEQQIATAKVLGIEAWHKAPGKKLEVKRISDASSDIIIGEEFMDESGSLNTCSPFSLRKSIECTVQEDCCTGPLGTKIQADEDRDAPHFLLHGWVDPIDLSGDEVWTTHARTASWAALYSWTGRLPKAGWCSLTQKIDLMTAPDVFGYIYLLEIGNSDFYAGDPGSRIAHVGAKAINAPDHTPETEGKIFARRDYGEAKYLGDFPEDDPDAYIFKGKTMHDAKLQILHTYRVMPKLKTKAS